MYAPTTSSIHICEKGVGGEYTVVGARLKAIFLALEVAGRVRDGNFKRVIIT